MNGPDDSGPNDSGPNNGKGVPPPAFSEGDQEGVQAGAIKAGDHPSPAEQDKLRAEAAAALAEAAGPDGRIDNLAEAALWLAVLETPRPRLDFYRDHLAVLRRDVGLSAESRADSPADVHACAEALRAALAGRHGYRGDGETYDDPQNADLIRVIDRRKGLPVALGILYIDAGRAQGWQVAGLAFPGHFLLRIDYRGGRAVLDPFGRGVCLEARDLRALLKAGGDEQAELKPAHTRALNDREILLRLQNNIKTRALHNRDLAGAAGAVERMLIIAPGRAALWREAGLLYARQGRTARAVEALETYLERGGSPSARHRAAALLQELRNRLDSGG